MAWHKSDNDGGNPPNKGPRKPDMPPDLDEVFKKLQQKLKSVFGNKIPLGAGSLPKLPDSRLPIGALISFVCIIALLIGFFAGFFVVEFTEKAVVLRWGKYQTTQEPGLHWAPIFIYTKYIINVQKVKTYPYQAEMLTQDENIVSVDLVVQYRINNLENYLFSVQNPDESLQQATASALRQVIGQTTLDEVLTSGREKVRQQTQIALEKILQRYHTGLIITDVNMQPVKPPDEVTAAFDDAIKAREDEQRFRNQAMTYANRFVPVAVGKAARIMAEANAYQQQAVLEAEGAAAQFLALLPQYQASPEVTRQRLYLDALQSVLSRTPKIFTDMSPANNLMYLPLDKLMKKSQSSPVSSSSISEKSRSTAAQNPINAGADSAANLNLFPGRPSYSIQRGG